MPIIKLWDVVGLGLIINHPTGIYISNQTGGTACLQSSIEGIYMPLCNDYETDTLKFISPEIELSQYFNDRYNGTGTTNGIDAADVKYITKLLSKFRLDDFVKINIDMLRQSHEAWIYVIIYPEKSNGLLDNFNSELNGVLTWSNSD